jgi:hypothetical protein
MVIIAFVITKMVIAEMDIADCSSLLAFDEIVITDVVFITDIGR